MDSSGGTATAATTTGGAAATNSIKISEFATYYGLVELQQEFATFKNWYERSVYIAFLLVNIAIYVVGAIYDCHSSYPTHAILRLQLPLIVAITLVVVPLEFGHPRVTIKVYLLLGALSVLVGSRLLYATVALCFSVWHSKHNLKKKLKKH